MGHPEPESVDFIQEAARRRFKIKWMKLAMSWSRFPQRRETFERINEKIAALRKKTPELSSLQADMMVENMLWAKLFRHVQNWKIQERTLTPHPKSPVPFPDPGAAESPKLFKEQGILGKRYPTIFLPGFVPEGSEAFYLIRGCFAKYGAIYYLNYPKSHFDKEKIFQTLFHLIHDINRRKVRNAGVRRKPFLVGTSFGCYLIAQFLQWLKDRGWENRLWIQGVVLISPVLCLHDVFTPGLDKQPTLVSRAIAPLFDVDPQDKEAVLERMARAKTVFSRMFFSGRETIQFSEKKQIPIMAIEDEVLGLFNTTITDQFGYFQRYRSLKDTPDLEGTLITTLPTLVLLAEGERDVLTPQSPTLTLLESVTQASQLFPRGMVETVMAEAGSPRQVTHSDLIFHAGCFRRHLDAWLPLVT